MQFAMIIMKKLGDQLKELPKNYIALFMLSKENYENSSLEILKEVIKSSKKTGVYITINKPYSTLISLMKDKGIDTKKIFFIDCVTRKGNNSDNVIFLDSPSRLTAIGVALDPVFKSSKFSFIFMDSLDSLVVYNGEEVVIKFIRHLMEKARESNIKGIIISLKENADKLATGDLSLICDKIINLV